METYKRKTRRKKRLLEASSDIVYRTLSHAGLRDEANRVRIFQCWEDAVGSKIAARTEPQMFRQGVLLIKAASPTWQNELSFLKAEIIVKLNNLIGKRLVRELKVVSGHLLYKSRGAHTQPPYAVPKATDFAVARQTSLPIVDDDVRLAFEKAMAMAKAHQARRLLPKRQSPK